MLEERKKAARRIEQALAEGSLEAVVSLVQDAQAKVQPGCASKEISNKEIIEKLVEEANTHFNKQED